MTAEEYKQLLEKPEIPMEIWYEFFLEKGGKQIGLEDFTSRFKIVTDPGEHMVIGSNNIFKWVSMGSALKHFHEHYKEKFGL